jgi:hypothetical protein
MEDRGPFTVGERAGGWRPWDSGTSRVWPAARYDCGHGGFAACVASTVSHARPAESCIGTEARQLENSAVNDRSGGELAKLGLQALPTSIRRPARPCPAGSRAAPLRTELARVPLFQQTAADGARSECAQRLVGSHSEAARRGGAVVTLADARAPDHGQWSSARRVVPWIGPAQAGRTASALFGSPLHGLSSARRPRSWRGRRVQAECGNANSRHRSCASL